MSRVKVSWERTDDDGNPVESGMNVYDMNDESICDEVGCVMFVKYDKPSDTVDHVGARPRKHG